MTPDPSTPDHFRKIVVSEYGDESALKWVWASLPAQKPGFARLRVLASGVSGADVNMRRGLYPFQPKPPLTPGYVVVGEVLTPGTNSPFKVGDRVASLTVLGGYAEFVELPERHLVPLPSANGRSLDPSIAAALVLDGMTAYQMFYRVAQLGQSTPKRVFIHGLSGAVGSALGLFAKKQGHEIFGTASPAKSSELVQRLGATVFDYRMKSQSGTPTFVSEMTTRGGVDVVFDPLGYESFSNSWTLLRAGGLVVGYGLNQQGFNGKKGGVILPVLTHFARNLRFWERKRATFYGIKNSSKNFQPDLRKLMEWAVRGDFQPWIKASFPLDQVEQAHRAWASHPGMGSIVLVS